MAMIESLALKSPSLYLLFFVLPSKEEPDLTND